MVIASETPIVLYCHASIPCFWIEFLTVLPRSRTNVKTNLGTLCKTSALAWTFVKARLTMHTELVSAIANVTNNKHVDLSLAWIALPPHRSHSNVRATLH